MAMSDGGPEVPAALAITEPQLDGKLPVRLTLAIRNPTPAAVWIGATVEGSFLRVHPAIATVAAGSVERVTVIVETAGITRENYASGRIRLAWRALPRLGAEPAGPEGERVVTLDVPRPRQRFSCPRVACGGTVREGDRSCLRCGLVLRFCPTCGTANSRSARACRADAHHSLPQCPGWPQIGGSGARDGAWTRPLARRASLAWKVQPHGLSAAVLGAPVVAYEVVYVMGAQPSGEAHLYTLDLQTGALLWEARLPAGEAAHPERGAPAVCGETLYLATVGGYVIALEATSGQQRWASRIPERIFAAPVAGENRVCVATTRSDMAEGHLVTLRADDGAKLSSYALGSRADTPPALHGTTAYATCDAGAVCAVATDTGNVIWRVEADGEFEAGASVVEGVVYAGTTGGELLAMDARDGSERWRVSLANAAIETLPVVADGRIYCGTADGWIHTVSTAGKPMGAVSVGVQVRGAPIAGPGGLLFGADDGRLYHSDGIQSLDPVYDTGRGRRISVPLALSFPYLLFSATGGELFALKLEEN
jgi:outer membrane protein assembly factor BamB